jgi:hypothetical protein
VGALLPGADLLRPDIGIEQSHRRISMATGTPELGAVDSVVIGGWIGNGGSAVICTSVNISAASAASEPRRTCRRFP